MSKPQTKKRGRPRKEAVPRLEELPAWAVKRILELSKKSGVSPHRARDHALKLGLYAVSEQYTTLIESQESADKLFNEQQVSTRTETEGGEGIDVAIPRSEVGDDPEVASLPEPEKESPDQNGSLDVTLGSRFEPESITID